MFQANDTSEQPPNYYNADYATSADCMVCHKNFCVCDEITQNKQMVKRVYVLDEAAHPEIIDPMGYIEVPTSDLYPGYCCTVHKMQGSEAKEVYYRMCYMDNTELFYTAITRAKSKAHVCTTKYILETVLKRSAVRSRTTGLYHRLVEAFKASKSKKRKYQTISEDGADVKNATNTALDGTCFQKESGSAAVL
jgi:hypothetical protein